MTNLLIFSKDRACQLDLLLRSIIDHFNVPYVATIIYTYSSDFYKGGYNILIKEYPNFKFVKETNFKADVLNALKGNFKYFTSLGDDCVVQRRLDHSKEFGIFDANTDILALNYRMGPNLRVVWEGDPEISLPKFISDYIWNWQKGGVKGWYYPMALMSQFYRMADIADYLPGLSFACPTGIEAAMMCNKFKHKPLMICFPESKVVELVINRVQNMATKNRFGNISTEYLNRLWLDGMRIKKESVYVLPYEISRFFNVNLEFEDR